MLHISSNNFKYEHQMISHIENGLIETLPYLQSCDHVLKAHEISLGWGVVDLVMRPSMNKSVKKPITSLSAIQTLCAMNNDEIISLNQLSQRTLIKKDILSDKIITLLLNGGHVQKFNNKYKKVVDLNTQSNDLIAIEAKLRNWKRALKQALRYKLFADRVFVVLADTYINPLIRGGGIEMFENQGVGLATVNTGGHTNVLVQAKKNKPYSKPINILAHQILEKTCL